MVAKYRFGLFKEGFNWQAIQERIKKEYEKLIKGKDPYDYPILRIEITIEKTTFEFVEEK